jgi:hypothetical protein
MYEEAQELHHDEDHCEEFPMQCIDKLSGKVPTPQELTLWSQFGASGPFVNSSGYPIGQDLPMKCICDILQDGIKPSEVTHFIARLWGPSECVAGPTEPGPLAILVPCDGSFQRQPHYGVRDTWESEGVPNEVYDALTSSVSVAAVGKLFHARATREGHTEWAVPKEPYIGIADTCIAKGVTGVPIPGHLISPWCGIPPDANPTAPNMDKKDLCSMFSAEYSWCPSKQNPLMKVMESWDHDAAPPVGLYADGTSWHPVKREDCEKTCAKTPEGTAYISKEMPLGLSV